MARIHYFPAPDLSAFPTLREMMDVLRYDRADGDSLIFEFINNQPAERQNALFETYIAAKLEVHGDPHMADTTALKAMGLPPRPTAKVIPLTRPPGKTR